MGVVNCWTEGMTRGNGQEEDAKEDEEKEADMTEKKRG